MIQDLVQVFYSFHFSFLNKPNVYASHGNEVLTVLMDHIQLFTWLDELFCLFPVIRAIDL